ncbi:MAG: transposase [Gemmataceae bacterium]
MASCARLQQAVIEDCHRAELSRVRHRWNGRRLFLVDGSNFSMRDTPELQAAFGQHPQQRMSCGFPTAHLLIQFAAHSGFALKTIVAPRRTRDMARAAATHEALGPGDILVGDRAFCQFYPFGRAARARLARRVPRPVAARRPKFASGIKGSQAFAEEDAG